jgi:hypothetical protein
MSKNNFQLFNCQLFLFIVHSFGSGQIVNPLGIDWISYSPQSGSSSKNVVFTATTENIDP